LTPVSADHRAIPTASLVHPGDLVAGKYRVAHVIAVGGMGVVMAARHEELDQQVALKVMRPDAMRSEESVARFVREAKTAARLQSEHVARVFDVGTIEGVPFMVMEHLSGLDLQQVVDTRGPLPISDAVDYVLQTLEAVAEAHSIGVVHRDLKPSNIFLAARADGSSRIKVLDFGISKEHSLDAPMGEALTATKQVIGSPGYMSPEQMLTPRSVDGRTDVWAVGVLLFELIAGESPFRGETVAAVMTSILNKPPPKLRSKRPEAPEGLERVVDRCLKQSLTERFLNVADVARALAPFGGSHAKLSVERVDRALGASGFARGASGSASLAALTEPRAQTASTWAGTASRESSKRKRAAVIVAAFTLGLLVTIGWLKMRPGPALTATEASTPRVASIALAAGAGAAAVAEASAAAAKEPVLPAIAPAEAPPVAPSAEPGPTVVAAAPSARPIKKNKKKVDPLGDRQ
jgi:tRNA A-37 threonylcarbamoyl transferase component Bud32